ncbi:MAG: cell division protein FtsQ/DivIB [Salibaculum sp.]|uniref:cell division protein FtsQ/DivIB n=1 Tax=Salibaculum sp. TaxID=2855480 RepID=UPI00287078F6|nr:cell division protein FtsQ/DivIB [Salibaculum sp.]MDR9428526.1 cell division protein FtsQ/DivIB [Salibaculum sp.]MDR9481883.1 cell division protein FtsQ/DivIB [Salibaculum sp.]
MRTLRRNRSGAAPRDPAPSRWGYRFQRWMLTPGLRRLIVVGLPLLAVGGALTAWGAQEANRQMVAEAFAKARMEFLGREEFSVRVMAVDGADEALSREIRTVLPVEFPTSSFELDLKEMRARVAALAPVAEAALRVRPGGVLQVTVEQRQPVAVFRGAEGLRLIDAEGVLIAPVTARADRADLPLITGDGARAALAEGLRLYDVAGPIRQRMRAVVRMGERRWDVVLDRGQRILLPTQTPIRAFERVIALDQAQDLLARDVSVIDMRNTARPTIRLNEQAVAELRRVNGEEPEAGDE